jgi:hypothetical protein
MKYINRLKQITLASGMLLSAWMIIGCGGGSSSTGDEASFSNSGLVIDINVSCVVNPNSSDIENYITLESGDLIVKDNTGAEIEIYHDINNTKKVCYITESAHILRQQ